MAPKRINTRANPQKTPVTPVSNLEQILRRGRIYQGSSSKSGKSNVFPPYSKKLIEENTESSSFKVVSDKSIVTEESFVEEPFNQNVTVE